MNKFQQMTLFFCIGILPVQLLIALPPIYILILAFFVALGVYKWAKWLSFLLFGFVMATGYAAWINNNGLPRDLESKEVLISGQVIGLPIQTDRSTGFLFKVDKVLSPANIVAFPTKIRLNWYNLDKQVRSAERWQLLVKLKRPHGLINPHGFDFEKWLFQQQIGATGYVRKSTNNQRMGEASRWVIGYWRESLKKYLEEALNEQQQAGIINALVLGDRQSITPGEWRVFRQTGTSHLIAISGLHIGLVSALFFGVVRWFVLRLPTLRGSATRCAIIVSIAAATGYAALAGFSIPTQRALIMLVVIMGGVFWQRHYNPFHVISMALLAVLIYDPLAPMSVGFWLSFCAVFIILHAVVGRMEKVGFIKQLLYAQWWVSIGLMPLVLYFFHEVSLVAPLANIVAIPFVSFAIVPMLIIALLIALIAPSAGAYALKFSALLIDVLWQFLEALASVDYSTLMMPEVSIFACITAMVGVVFLLMPKGFIPKPLVCVLFLPVLFPIHEKSLAYGEFKLVLLDVGQGLSAVVHSADNTLVFDTGAKYSEKSDLASRVLVPYLNSVRTKQIKQLIISHGDNDHAGGAQTVLNTFDVNRLYTSVPELFKGYNPLPCENTISWHLNGVLFEFINPSADNLFEGNNASCVLKVSSVNGSVLLTGDIEKSAEYSLLQYKGHQLKADVMIAPHHGSTTSSSEKFIKAVDPDVVLFPVGYKNRFGFPKQEVIERYEKQGSRRLDTARHGAIIVRFYNHQGPRIESVREQTAKFWNWRH